MSASQERIPMLMRTTSNDITITALPPTTTEENFHHHQHGLIINNYNINNKNGFITRLCCHMMKGVQRNIQKCVAALVVISFFSIILLTQYMDSSSTLVGWVGSKILFTLFFFYNFALWLISLEFSLSKVSKSNRRNFFNEHTLKQQQTFAQIIK